MSEAPPTPRGHISEIYHVIGWPFPAIFIISDQFSASNSFYLPIILFSYYLTALPAKWKQERAERSGAASHDGGTKCFSGRSEGQRPADPAGVWVPKAEVAILLNGRRGEVETGGGRLSRSFYVALQAAADASVVFIMFQQRRRSIVVALPSTHLKTEMAAKETILSELIYEDHDGLRRRCAASKLLLSSWEDRFPPPSWKRLLRNLAAVVCAASPSHLGGSVKLSRHFSAANFSWSPPLAAAAAVSSSCQSVSLCMLFLADRCSVQPSVSYFSRPPSLLFFLSRSLLSFSAKATHRRSLFFLLPLKSWKPCEVLWLSAYGRARSCVRASVDGRKDFIFQAANVGPISGAAVVSRRLTC